MKHVQHDDYFDHSDDLVIRVRAGREAAQRKMEEFGDPSEYDITIIQGHGSEEPATATDEERAKSSTPVSTDEADHSGKHQTTVELIEGQEE